MQYRLFTIFLLFTAFSANAFAESKVESIDVEITPEVEVSVTRYLGKGGKVLLWFPSESGVLEQEKKVARKLAQSGIEVWLMDLHGAYFLPVLGSSTEKIPAGEVAALLDRANSITGKKVYLAGSGRGALLALRVAHAWQKKSGTKKILHGAVLISPKLFVETPEPGIEGKLMPVVNKTNLPIFIIQPKKSPWWWKMSRIVPVLEGSGSDVYLRSLEGVRDRFYYRPDATRDEDYKASMLDLYIRQATRLLESYSAKTRKVERLVVKAPEPVEGKKERVLRAYQGNPEPPALELEKLDGVKVSLEQYKGKVVLLNFWASWCPPCVHEMPSMQKLRDRLSGKGFEILAVNMAEDKQTIKKFLQEKVKVNFPILLDKDGAALRRWKVFAFPTSYVLDRNGKIRLALFGAIDWELKDVVQKIGKLLNE